MIRANFVTQLLGGNFGNDVNIHYAPWITAASDAGALVNSIDLQIMGGSTMSAPVRTAMLDAINKSPNAREKVLTALYIAFTSSPYQIER